ncbi:MAG: hypothetical protein ACOX5F_09155 [Anaerovoracaceae bacterium]|jgi:hypothetical protein
MSTVPRTEVSIPIDTIRGIDKLFGRKMKIDTTDVPRKFKKAFQKTREDVFIKLRVKGIYQSYGIHQVLEDQILLKDGQILDSHMYANMFNKSKELVFYVVSVFGYEELENATDDMVEKLFLDAWGSSVAEAAYYGLRQSIAMSLEEKGIYSTAAFSPGQHDVPMEIQKVIFGELQPEEIGVTLNDHFLMHPKKSISGAFGIGREKDERNLRPCDFCSIRETCSDSYNGDFL